MSLYDWGCCAVNFESDHQTAESFARLIQRTLEEKHNNAWIPESGWEITAALEYLQSLNNKSSADCSGAVSMNITTFPEHLC